MYIINIHCPWAKKPELLGPRYLPGVLIVVEKKIFQTPGNWLVKMKILTGSCGHGVWSPSYNAIVTFSERENII